MTWSHSMLSGTFVFIVDLRMFATVATLGSALRVSALLLQYCTTECRGAVGPSCRGGSSRKLGCALPDPGTRARIYPEVRNRNRCSCVFNSDGFRGLHLGCFRRAWCKRSPGCSGVGRAPQGGADCSSAGPATQWGGWVQVKLSRIALGSAVTLSLVGGSLLAAPSTSAQCVDANGDPVARRDDLRWHDHQ